jgi:hypothetical protein
MGGDLGRVGTLDCCFYTREQMSPKLAQSLHLHRHGKRRKKGSILVLLAVFLGFRVCTGVFLIEQCLLERETDTKTSPTLDFALSRGNASRTEGFNDLLCILRVHPALTSTEDHVPPLVAFGSHRD